MSPVKRHVSVNPALGSFSCILEVRGCCLQLMFPAVVDAVRPLRCGRSSYGSSKGSKLVIRCSKGSKLLGCNFHSQIYVLAWRGLYNIETTPFTSPAKGYCKSQPSYPHRHHTLSHIHTMYSLLTFHFLSFFSSTVLYMSLVLSLK